MKLIDEWRFQALRLWSNRFALLSTLFQGLALGLTAFTDEIKPWPFAVLAIVFTLGAFISRLVSQDKLKEKVVNKNFGKAATAFRESQKGDLL